MPHLDTLSYHVITLTSCHLRRNRKSSPSSTQTALPSRGHGRATSSNIDFSDEEEVAITFLTALARERVDIVDARSRFPSKVDIVETRSLDKAFIVEDIHEAEAEQLKRGYECARNTCDELKSCADIECRSRITKGEYNILWIFIPTGCHVLTNMATSLCATIKIG